VEEVSVGTVSVVYEKLGLRIVALLVLLELLSVYFLWILNPVGVTLESSFAVYLAVDLVAFVMISYVVRSIMRKDRFGRLPRISGALFIVLLVVAGLFI